jgi:hypothetical protein
MQITPFKSTQGFYLIYYAIFSRINQREKRRWREFSDEDGCRAGREGKEKEEDSRLPLTLGENYSALPAMT